jgi:hypothetical protein
MNNHPTFPVRSQSPYPINSWPLFVSIRSAERILRNWSECSTGCSAASRAFLPAEIHLVCPECTNWRRAHWCRCRCSEYFSNLIPRQVASHEKQADQSNNQYYFHSGCDLHKYSILATDLLHTPCFLSCQTILLRLSLSLGVVRSRWASRSSTPAAGRFAGRGGFDPHPLPPLFSKQFPLILRSFYGLA